MHWTNVKAIKCSIKQFPLDRHSYLYFATFKSILMVFLAEMIPLSWTITKLLILLPFSLVSLVLPFSFDDKSSSSIKLAWQGLSLLLLNLIRTKHWYIAHISHIFVIQSATVHCTSENAAHTQHTVNRWMAATGEHNYRTLSRFGTFILLRKIAWRCFYVIHTC